MMNVKAAKMSLYQLSNYYIDYIIHMVPGITNYLGTFSNDTLPLRLPLEQDFSLITNTSRQNTLGSHWIAITYTHKTKTLFLYDPLCLGSRYMPHIFNWLQKVLRVGCKVKTLRKPIQDMRSVVCAYFCIYAILLHSLQDKLTPAMKKNLKPFNKYMLQENDLIVMYNVNKLIKYASLL